ncbi:MAG TPA: helix-turn-helix transcriptional regulator [Ktedonosporobacter sp.]|nr:helix-turn-helix transcriptional regulator [Ktedonosporobacter sp.]
MANKKLKKARLRRLWTMAVAAEKVGVSLQTFSRWERGLQQPHLTTLKLLCDAFDMSAGDLGFGGPQ